MLFSFELVILTPGIVKLTVMKPMAVAFASFSQTL
jgi:hypothetical protein